MITDRPIRLHDYLPAVFNVENGAVVVFTGVVRADEKDGRRVRYIHYDCYREMAVKEMENVVEEVKASCRVGSIRAVHRVGDVPAGEVALVVVVEAGGREAAFSASRRTVDEIKRRVPIWKKEVYDDDSSQWL